MGMTPEQKARVSIDALLQQAGWHVCNVTDANIQRTQALRQATLAKAFSPGLANG
jgi:type I restriction enzyme R subunit